MCVCVLVTFKGYTCFFSKKKWLYMFFLKKKWLYMLYPKDMLTVKEITQF